MSFIKVASLNQIPKNRGLCIKINNKAIALFAYQEKIYAMDHLCPHQLGPLSEGMQYENIVICPWHGWQFDIQSGETVMGGEGVKTYPVEIQGSDIYLALDE